MKTFFLAFLCGAVVALLVLLGAALLKANDLLDLVVATIDSRGGVEYLAEPSIDQLVDRFNESGYDEQPIDPNEPLLTRRMVLVCEGMNERVARRVAERLVYLNGLDSKEPIDLWIATSGGWLDSAFVIVDTMRAIDAPVHVTAIGGCYSAGTVILAAATGDRIATPNAVLSIHVNDYYRDGDDFDADRQELRRFRRIYERHTRIPRAWFESAGDNQYYLDAPQALELGLIDRIATPKRDETDKPAAVPRSAA